jgi:hypothetical protein
MNPDIVKLVAGLRYTLFQVCCQVTIFFTIFFLCKTQTTTMTYDKSSSSSPNYNEQCLCNKTMMMSEGMVSIIWHLSCLCGIWDDDDYDETSKLLMYERIMKWIDHKI